MTTAEALAVVRSALGPRVPKKHASYLERVRNNTLDALAIIEQRLEELERRPAHLSAMAMKARAEKAEAERDEARKEAREADEDRDHVHRRNLAAEERVAELEAAIRHELGVTHGADTIDRLRTALNPAKEPDA